MSMYVVNAWFRESILGENKNWSAHYMDIMMGSIVKLIKRFVRNGLAQIKYEWEDTKRWVRRLVRRLI